ncbi:MAG: polysulfide reductase NrfD [Gammaproteobacteria bacterium]|nr:polysulfide reductase NrfD [Gammaproteobacteria bacterium]
MKYLHYLQIKGNSKAYITFIVSLAVIILIGLLSVYQMEHQGHWITGMNNQVVWGLPHVFAIFLIVAASGALNVASISSALGKKAYKPLARLSGVMAIGLLVGGLVILLLDLGRPDRLIVAMTEFNFTSIFTWNIFLYSGFIGIVAVYSWTMLDRPYNKFTNMVGTVAFVWRLILTMGTGSIFGMLISREAYDSALLAPMFIIMSFSFGLAVYLLYLLTAYRLSERPLGDYIVTRLRNLLGIFVAAVAFMVLIYHLTFLYSSEHRDVSLFILLDGGIYTSLFWIGQIILGTIAPLAIIYTPSMKNNRNLLSLASVLIILGGFVQLYIIIIGGQAYPIQLFPGYEVTSTFADGIVAQYSPSINEFLLGIAGVSISLLIITIALRLFHLLPLSLEDKYANPHHS